MAASVLNAPRAVDLSTCLAIPAQVEIWFNLITQRAIRRGTFRSVKELIQKIEQFVEHYNMHSRAFVRTATADSILEKIHRLCQRISGTGHPRPADKRRIGVRSEDEGPAE
jgi:hypothetical protein